MRILETVRFRNHNEMTGFPTEPKLNENGIIVRLARAAGLGLIEDRVYLARRVRPMKTNDDTNSQDIIAQFYRPDVCDRFLDSATKLRKAQKQVTAEMVSSTAKPVPVFVSKRISRELTRLRWLAMQRKSALEFDFCWSSDSGRLCMN